MLNTLQFNMSVPTPYVFMRRFLKAAQSDKKVDPHYINNLYMFIKTISLRKKPANKCLFH